MKEVVLEPSVALLESMRSVGYSLEAAVADLIDNSLDADATSVEIDIDVVEGQRIAFLDNGNGMTQAKAKEALRLAGTVDDDRPERLGRFGLGLKTASISQGRSLSVISRHNGSTIAYRWDLDHVKNTGSWSLLELEESDWSEVPFHAEMLGSANATLIVWENLDLLLGDAEEPGPFLASTIEPLLRHIGLTYHRLLEPGKDGLRIAINGQPVEAIDPFLKSNPRTQYTPTETIEIGADTVSFTAYTLPHQSGLRQSERGRHDLGEAMRDFQGFYIYRNKRLISKGHWFGLTRMGELTKLTRIQVDIPRELDSLWQLDVKKSSTQPPASFKAHLKNMMDPILNKGRRVHTFRGRRESSDTFIHLWDKVKDRTGFRYEINTENPLVQAALLKLDSTQASQIVGLFDTIASQYPVLDVYNEMASNTAPMVSKSDNAGLTDKLLMLKQADILGADRGAAHSFLKNVEPFNQAENLVELIEQVWGTDE